ncbi:MAG: outer membrane protein assembly factor BamD [Rickettsiales bacterium]|nr:outer membrane protein assembly factor BamD [Rickettsiales bacterium]
MKKIFRGLAAVILASCGGGGNIDYAAKTDREIYDIGLASLREEYYAPAAQEFMQIEYNHPYSTLVGKSWIMAGYSYYMDGKYAEAIEAFEKLAKYRPSSPLVPYATYMIAMSYYDQMSPVNRDQRATELALASMEKLVKAFPDSEYAADVKPKIIIARNNLAAKEMFTAKELLRKKNVIAALNRYQTVIARYQTSLFVPEALFRAVELYLIINERESAEDMARLLQVNYPDSEWHKMAAELLAQSPK